MMATKIYDVETILLIDGTEVRLTPLKIKYLREFMEIFEGVKKSSNDDEAIQFLLECALTTMKQYYPKIKTIEELEDSINLPAIYRIIDIAAGIRVNENNEEESIKDQATESSSTWENLDLAKLESEVFLLGIWKDYEELESSLSMPELVATLGSKRELDYSEKKFLAAIQGVDLDKQSGKEEANAWEKMKAKVFSGGKSSNPNDVLALQGANAQRAGFGIGMGIGYEDLTKK
jgi:hypothetical protein